MSSAIGHLLELKAPEEYEVKRGKWSFAHLPVIPPHFTLNYVWTGANISERFIASPYTGKAYMVVLERGKEKVGQGVEESVNVLEDYRKAFGKEPPATAGIAVMSDSDNTKTSAEAYLDFIEVEKSK